MFLTLGSIVEVGVDGRAPDDVGERENHGRDILLDDLGRIVGINQMSQVQGQLKSGRKDAENALVDQAFDGFNLERKHHD